MAEKLEKHSKSPRIVNDVAGYRWLPPDVRRLVDERMKARAQERDGAKSEEEEESP